VSDRREYSLRCDQVEHDPAELDQLTGEIDPPQRSNPFRQVKVEFGPAASWDDIVREALIEALRIHGAVRVAGPALGIPRSTLGSWCRRLEVPVPRNWVQARTDVRVLACVHAYHDLLGRPPTGVEVQECTRVSGNTVTEAKRRLIAAGHLRAGAGLELA
jgi:hypothetical protein